MAYFETINEMTTGITDEMQMPKEKYLEVEAELVEAIGNYVVGNEVNCVAYGLGKVTAYTGDTLDRLIVDIAFENENKKFSLMHIMNNKFIKFADIFEVGDAWDAAFIAHNKITDIYKECERILRQQQYEAMKKAEADKKAEEKYKKQKEKAIKDFDALINREKVHSEINEFYYALGWLAKHVGTVSAAMPDYLSSSFKKYFGEDAVHTVIDSKKRTVNGYPMQWALSMKATLKKAETLPAILKQYLNTSGKALADTAFVCDLVKDYGFQFGKKQSVEQIVDTIPAKYIDSFEAGLAG